MKKPQSCSSITINLVGLSGFFIVMFLYKAFQPDWSLSTKLSVSLLATVLPIIILEYYFKSSPMLSRIFISSQKGLYNWKRVVIKLIALYFIFSLIAIVYWVFSEYHSDFFNPFWEVLFPILPWLILFSIPYFFIVDAYLVKPEDSYYTLGLWLVKQGGFNKEISIQLFLGWVVKLFFLPLMIVYFSGNLVSLQAAHNNLFVITTSFQNFFNYSWLVLFTVDLVFGCAGYVLTMKIFDTQIRSTEPTTLGWVSALACYQPFYGGISASYFVYNMDNLEWGRWLADSPTLFVIWGAGILVFLVIYSFSTVVFGIRFSNLTNRGIITNGPYRFVKHPAYVAKNISWWMVGIPFISQSNDVSEILRSCIMLLCLNGLYYVRAKTEERHLMADSTYREYSEWIEQNGLFTKVKRIFS